MATKRTRLHRAMRSRVTPRCAELWRQLNEIDANARVRWEDEGGRCREFLDAALELHHALGRKPWMQHVEDVVHDAPPEWMTAERLEFTDWHGAVELRRALEESVDTS